MPRKKVTPDTPVPPVAKFSAGGDPVKTTRAATPRKRTAHAPEASPRARAAHKTAAAIEELPPRLSGSRCPVCGYRTDALGHARSHSHMQPGGDA